MFLKKVFTGGFDRCNPQASNLDGVAPPEPLLQDKAFLSYRMLIIIYVVRRQTAGGGEVWAPIVAHVVSC